jgi:hypothetical protein
MSSEFIKIKMHLFDKSELENSLKKIDRIKKVEIFLY